MDKIIVYAAQYSECVYESAFATISIHKTRSGAENAIKLHKKTIYDMYKENYAWQKENYPDEYVQQECVFPEWQQWKVVELEIMNENDFCYWLNGYIELNGKLPSPQQWEMIKERLKLVFNKVTPTKRESLLDYTDIPIVNC